MPAGRAVPPRLPHVLEALRESLWFVPGALSLAGVGLAIALVVWQGPADRAVGAVVPWLFQGEPDSARTVMTAIASSMATTAGTTFSVTVVALTLASRQFGPRILRGFLRDRLDQLTIGAFIGTFLYALVVLRCIRNGEDGVPNVAVSVGFLLAMASMGLLIAFIHHVAASIQVSSVLAGIVSDTLSEIPRAFPEPIGDDAPPEAAPGVPEACRVLRAERHGYVQSIDAEALLTAVQRADVRLALHVAPGEFLAPDAPLGSAWPPERADASLLHAVRRAIVLGARPTLPDNPAYGLGLVADIAVKALGEEVDPTTALHCVDASTVLLHRILSRRRPSDLRRGRDGTVRVVTRGRDFAELLDAGLGPIRRYATGEAAVLARLLGALGFLHDRATARPRRAALRAEAARVLLAASSIADPDDRRAVVAAGAWSRHADT